MSEHVPSEKPESTPFEKMTALAARVMSVPKKEVDRRAKQWRDGNRKPPTAGKAL